MPNANQPGTTKKGKAGLLSAGHLNQVLAYAILGMTLGIMLAVVWPSLNATGYLSAWDAGGHLLKAHYFAHNLLAGGHLSGWFPLWHGGFDLFQFYPPLLYYIMGPLSVVVDPELALRLTTAALWLGLVPVTYYFLRSFQLERIIAAAGTSLLLALNASFGIGLGALYGVGLLPNGLGFIMAIWALGRLKRDLSQPDRRPYQFTLTGLVVGLLFLAHTFSAYWFLLASALLLLSEIINAGGHRSRALKRYGFVLALALLVSAYWWMPLVANLGQMGPTGPIQQSSKLEISKDLLLARDSGGWVLSLLAVGGLLYLAVARRLRTLAFLGSLSLLSFLLSLNLINDALPFRSIIASSQFIRFHAFFSWLLMVLAVFGLAGIWQLCKRIKLPYVPQVIFAGGLVLLFVLVLMPTLDLKRGFVHVSNNQATAELPQVANYLSANLRPGESILSEFNWDSRLYFGSPHFVNQRLNFLTNQPVWDLDGNFPEGTLGAAQPVLIASVMDQTDYLATQQTYLQSRGIRYLVSTNPTTAAKLQQQPWLREVYSGRALSIFELVTFNRTFGLPPEVAAQVRDVTYRDPGTYRVTFRQPVSLPANTSTMVSYHPWLEVFGDTTRLNASPDLYDRLSIPSGSAPISELTIRYQPKAVADFAGTISLVAFIVVALSLLRPRLLSRVLEVARPRRRRAKAATTGKPQHRNGLPKWLDDPAAKTRRRRS